MAEGFTPYWLIHEPGKQHGFAVVRDPDVLTAEEALARWRASDEVAEWREHGIDMASIPAEARRITEPFDARSR